MTGAEPTPPPWWAEAVVYQVYVRSFADSDGDGIGDLPGITSRLDHIAGLGADAVWLTPFYRSPQHDHGYDVADHTRVDPLFGSLADAEELLRVAHGLGLKVIVDLVPNHTSIEHPWFAEALAGAPGGSERERYVFRTGRAGGEDPPNNWGSMFGGPAWTRVAGTDQWYLHLFDSSQPDLNWRHPDVPAMFEAVLGFWLDRGVDGFRIDIAHGLFKEASLRDKAEYDPTLTVQDEPMFDQPEVHEVYRSWRRITDGYSRPGAERMFVAEAWTQTPEALAAYLRADELQQAFNFEWLYADFSAAAFAGVIERTMSSTASIGAWPTWVLNNHDVVRHVTRYGGGEIGAARARAATLTMLALPGSAYLYQGEELGLAEAEVPDEARQDPAWFRMGIGRDGCRVPLPWSGAESPFGFSPDGSDRPWLPQPADWAAHSVEAQDLDAEATLAFVRAALVTRREHALGTGREVSVVAEQDLLVLRRGELTVALNCGDTPVAMPSGEVLLGSGADWPRWDRLPANNAVWVRSTSEDPAGSPHEPVPQHPS